jgi:uncharacterized protein YigE (DUF2233 family)
MMRTAFLRTLLLLIIGMLGSGLAQPAAAANCEAQTLAGNSYTVCKFDPAHDRIAVFNLDAQGQPYANFTRLAEDLVLQKKRLVFATNAGMFGEDLKPIGLYIENGKISRKLNRRSGSGNFHLKPNGVFLLRSGKAWVMDSETYVRSGIRPDFATQSGPMLVINGSLHPKFSEAGPSMKIRNGVGIGPAGEVILVKSETAVNFHSFASYFRDVLGCRNALFLDGSISSLYSLELGRNEGFLDLGPMIGVYDIP